MGDVLVLGIPRGGTTWVGQALGHARTACYVHEPDNPDLDAFARASTRSLWLYPVLRPGDRCPPYERLWDVAFRGGFPARRLTVAPARAAAARARLSLLAARPLSRLPRRRGPVVCKSVYAAFSAEWLAARRPVRVVVVRRALLDVAASWLSVGFDGVDLAGNPRVRSDWLEPLGIDPPAPDEPRGTRVGFTVALLDRVLEVTAARNPGWVVVRHEDLCEDPPAAFRRLAHDAGLTWSDDVDRYLVESDVDGAGFQTRRVSRDEPGKWRRRLSDEQVDEVRRGLARSGVVQPA